MTKQNLYQLSDNPDLVPVGAITRELFRALLGPVINYEGSRHPYGVYTGNKGLYAKVWFWEDRVPL